MYNEYFAPRISGDTRSFWENCREHRLTVQKCAKCGHLRWPASYVCPECLSEETEIVELPEEGVLYSYVVMRRPFHPAVAEKVPYIVAEVDFPGGVRLVTNLVDCEAEELKCGQRVRLVWRDGEEYVSPVFTPVKEK